MAKKRRLVTVAERIQGILERKEWLPEWLARESGLSSGHVNELLQGKYQPGLNSLVKIAAALGVTVGELLGERPPKSPKPRRGRGAK